MLFKTKLGDPIVAVQVVLSFSQREMDTLTKQAKRARKSIDDYVRDVVKRQLR